MHAASPSRGRSREAELGWAQSGAWAGSSLSLPCGWEGPAIWASLGRALRLILNSINLNHDHREIQEEEREDQHAHKVLDPRESKGLRTTACAGE